MTDPSNGVPGEQHRLKPGPSWRLLRAFIGSWLGPAIRLKAYGRERVPRSGAVVYAANHVSAMDVFALGISSPRDIHYMAKAELFSVPVVGTIVAHSGAFGVRRGEADREAIRNGRAVLEAGRVLGVFIEGTRQVGGEVGEAYTGATMLAVSNGAAIQPVFIHGTDRRLGGPATVVYGTPIATAGLPRRSRTYRALATHVEEELRSLQRFAISAAGRGRPPGLVPPESRQFEVVT